MSAPALARTTVATLLLLATPLAAEITLRVKGSDTIGGALGPDLAEAYHLENPETFIVWEALGSSTAFVGLFDGSADLGAASRPIKASELDEAKKRGLAFKEYVIGYDGIAILVHPSNDLPQLTIDDASRIFQGKIKNFREVGGPDRPVRVICRPSYSGTHQFFKEKVLRKGNSKGPEEFAPATEWVEHSAEIVQRVSKDPNAISFLGLGWIKPGTRAVPVAPGKGQKAVAATLETVRDGSYPVFRSLYLYTPGEPQGELRNLMAYILSPAGQQLVEANGFVQADVTTPMPYRAARGPAPAAPVPAPVPQATVVAAAAPRPAPIAAPAHADPTIVRVYFSFGGARLTDEAGLKIVQAAETLRAGHARALVIGHADSMGARDANQRVSAARAQVVYGQLLQMGVPRERLSIQAKGSDEPIASNATADGRGQNRRVDIVLVAE